MSTQEITRVDYWNPSMNIDFEIVDLQLFLFKNQVHRAEVNKNVKGYVIHINEPFFYKINSLDSEMFLEFVDRAYGREVINFDTSRDQMNRTLIELIYQTYNKGGRSVDQDLLASLFQSFILSLKTTTQLEEGHYGISDFENYKYK